MFYQLLRLLRVFSTTHRWTLITAMDQHWRPDELRKGEEGTFPTARGAPPSPRLLGRRDYSRQRREVLRQLALWWLELDLSGIQVRRSQDLTLSRESWSAGRKSQAVSPADHPGPSIARKAARRLLATSLLLPPTTDFAAPPALFRKINKRVRLYRWRANRKSRRTRPALRSGAGRNAASLSSDVMHLHHYPS